MPYTPHATASSESEAFYELLVGSSAGKTGHNDDMDAFRHAYVSGVYAMERGSSAAAALGYSAQQIALVESILSISAETWETNGNLITV